MISGISHVILYVEDQDRAKRFWTETLGFEVVRDTPMGDDGSRWLEVTPPDKAVKLTLQPAAPDWPNPIGTLSWMLFTCVDIQKTYEELTERGVEFTDPPREEPWGWWAVFKDPDGHLFGMGQSPA